MIELKFSDITEHDIDLLLVEEFFCSQKFIELFIEPLNIENAKVISIQHSKIDPELGESDIVVILESGEVRIALLIEDKIDAAAMPNQAERYLFRGEKGIANGEYDRFCTYIVAPSEYILSNDEASKYQHKITYEQILDYFEEQNNLRAAFKRKQLMQAIHKQRNGYQVVENINVTEFWRKYISYQKSHYPNLKLVSSAGKKGSRASWPQFNTHIKGMFIYHKSEFGYVDLTFNGTAKVIDRLDIVLKQSLGDYSSHRLTLQVTGKSAALRLECSVLNFKEPFEEQIESVRQCFEAIEKMSDVAKRLDTVNIMQIIEST